jgi:CBS-domain-containing membrane protein
LAKGSTGPRLSDLALWGLRRTGDEVGRSNDMRQPPADPYDLDSRLIHAMSAVERTLRDEFARPHRDDEPLKDLLQQSIKAGRLSTPEVAELERLWQIRSILAHENRTGRPPIAATLPGVVRAEQLGEKLRGEPLARLDTFAPAPPSVVTVTPETSLGDAVTLMATNDFTSLPVVDTTSRCIALLSTQDVAHWLGHHLGKDGIVENTTVEHVMHLAGDDFVFVSRDLPQREARRRFVDHTQRTGAPLMALLITKQGTEREPLLGIVTPWDLPYLTPPAEVRVGTLTEG